MLVIRPWLLVGNYQETFKLTLLRAQSIKAMLQFAEPVNQPGMANLYLPLEDGTPIPPDVFREGMDFILRHYTRGEKVFVSCGAGISRSVAFTVAALKETENIPLLAAYQEVLKVHPQALPHPKLWQSLCAVYQESSPYWLLLKLYNKKG
jgi:protein-tyrosine phosphatase